MGKIEQLCRNYERYVSLPWDRQLSGAERVWFAVYDKMDERRLRRRLEEFEIATQRAGHLWDYVDLTDAFAEWMAEQKYRDSYFEAPDDLEMALDGFKRFCADRIANQIRESREPDNTVVAVVGVAGLFGFVRASEVLQAAEREVRGRLLVFFPGQYEDNNYRLLDARDGWNYMAIPITTELGAIP